MAVTAEVANAVNAVVVAERLPSVVANAVAVVAKVPSAAVVAVKVAADALETDVAVKADLAVATAGRNGHSGRRWRRSSGQPVHAGGLPLTDNA